MCGTVRWSGGRECCVAALCPAMSSQPRRSAYRASDRVTEDTVRAAAAAPPPACDAERAVTAVLAARVPPPTPPQPHQRPQQQPERMHVHLALVPRGEGTDATWSRRARRAHGGNRRGRERRLLRELTEPAAAAAAADGAAPPPMLRESSDGEGGAAPHTRPGPGSDGPPGQRRWVAVVPPAAPPSRAPSAAGYAADKSSVQSGSVWSDFFSHGSTL